MDFAYRISELVRTHFLQIWALVLICAISIGLFYPYQRARLGGSTNVRPTRSSWKLNNSDIVCLSFFVLFLALYVWANLWKEDFAFTDNVQLTGFSLRGKSYPAPIWPKVGRLFPLQFQEFNVLRHLTQAPAAFRGFVVLQLLLWASVTVAYLSEFTIPLRVLALFLIMCTPSFVISFSDLIYPERNILFWVAVFSLCWRRYSATASPVFLAGTFIAVQFAVYYKEPVWLLFAGFAGTQLVYNWNGESHQGSTRNFIRDNLANIGTMALAVLFPVLFALVMFYYRSLRYVRDARLTISLTVLDYVKVDFLLFVFLALVVIRALKLFRGQSKPNPFWDPLAAGGAIYAVAIIGLRMFEGYYMAPVDAIAILFLLQWAHSWRLETKTVRTFVVAVVCLVSVVQNLACASVFLTMRKNMIACRVQLSDFLKEYIQERSGGPVGLFFPHSDVRDLIGLSAFLDYKGLPLINDASYGRGDQVSLLFKSPLSFPQNHCVDYRPYTCYHADAPQSGDLIVESQWDDTPEDEVARNGREQLLFSYEPLFVSQKSLPFFEYFKTITAFRNDLPNRWLQMHVYKYSAP